MWGEREGSDDAQAQEGSVPRMIVWSVGMVNHCRMFYKDKYDKHLQSLVIWKWLVIPERKGMEVKTRWQSEWKWQGKITINHFAIQLLNIY